jgi:hypothetical protein
MAHFIYPNANLYNVEPVGGEQTGGTNDFAANADVTNETRLTDVSTATAAGFPANFDAVRFDLGSTGNSFDSIAIHANASDTDDVNFYNSSSATSGVFANFISGSGFSTTFNEGWNVRTDMSSAVQYVFMRGGGELNVFTEVILGTKLNLTNVTLSGSEGKSFGNDVVTSYGGIEFSNLRHEGKRFYNFNLNHVNETYKTNLETMRDAVRGSHYKFLYYDDSTYHYVRMSKDSLQFKEVAVGVYDTKISLVEQLS